MAHTGYFWPGKPQIHGHIRHMYIQFSNPTHKHVLIVDWHELNVCVM